RPPRELFYLIEEKLATVITEKDTVRDLEERKRVLLEKLKLIIEPVDAPIDYRVLIPRVHSLPRIPVYRAHLDNLIYYMIRDKAGLGILEPVLKDPYIEDISCPGVGYIYIVHKIFGPLETNLKFETAEELDRFIIELSERIGKPVSHARPIVDATLPDGSRINIVFGTDVSLQGSNFTIRRVAKVPISVTQLVNWNTFDGRVAAYLWILLLEGSSGFVSGETASGKTTTLNAIVAFINPTAKIVTIEDTAELNIPHSNWVRELTRDTGSPETSVTMFDLLKAALRQRPNYIIVGEIRGAEGLIAFQAMQTGHPVLATFHAASVERLVQRLTSPPINVPKSQLDNLNFVVIQSAIYREGVLVRRVLSVNEIIGYDP
ncbi:MAG TPA: flagellar protein FlaI, partial [Pyrodictium sp.]|nr:flagellar protein FlaI [Pyrodictium sp.]